MAWSLKIWIFAGLILTGICFQTQASIAFDLTAGSSGEYIQTNLDLLWLMLAAALVLLMQVGFLLLEAGMVRSKNAINVAQKNLLDLTFSVLVFAAVGFMFAFGRSDGLPFGFDSTLLMLSNLDAWGAAIFVFQVMFCGTAATIVSGAVAERMPLSAYVLASIFIAGILYPFFVHWSWGSVMHGNPTSFLSNMGFIDFAGSTVVHGTGAWFALAACIVIGARKGRFDAAGNPIRIQGHSPLLATAGALLLFVGWIGFNGGSVLAMRPDVSLIILNTVLAGTTGAAAGYVASLFVNSTVYPEKIFSGMIGGLVAVTAGCAVLEPSGAMVIGFLGGAVAIMSNDWLESRFKIDDAVGAVGVHGFAGIVGTLGLALFAPVSNLSNMGRIEQLLVQLAGVGLNFAWAFGLGLVFFALLKRFVLLRVDAATETRGLDEAEHATRLGLGRIEDAVGRLSRGEVDLARRLPEIPGDNAEQLTHLFNNFMNTLEREEYARVSERDRERDSEEAERLKTLSNATFEAIVMAVNGNIIDGNKSLEDLLGLSLDQIKGRHMREFVPEKHQALLARQLKKSVAGPHELSVFHADGTEIPIEVRAREIFYRGKRTRIAAVVDLRERKAAEQRIRHLADHDPLTDLPNRRMFSDRLAQITSEAETTGSMAPVFMIDLDRFKDINDLHGHPIGDKVVKVIAQRLQRAIRDCDIVARMGGDEFAIVQRDIQFTNQATDLAHRLVATVAEPVDCGDGLIVQVGASIGIAIFPEHATDSMRLISRADTALYEAKARGKDRYCFFESDMEDAVLNRQLLESDLAKAMTCGQLELHLQPRLDLHKCEIVGHEALIRWRHPERGLISPNEFISVAEQSGRIVELGNWVLMEACRQAASVAALGCVSVNVSPLQIRDKAFLTNVAAALQSSGLPPSRLEIEITENVLMDNDDRAYAVLNGLCKMGVSMALDDFGTGYASLGYLNRFPFNAIKIDRSFVASLTTSEETHAIVETIIGLGAALKIRIVAEGVENFDELNALRSMGCDEIQGFLVSKPKPLADCEMTVPDNVSAELLNPSNHTDALVQQLRQTVKIAKGRRGHGDKEIDDDNAKTARSVG